MKNDYYLFWIFCIVLLPLLCGCNDEREPEPKPEPDVVSEINPELIFASTSPQTITFTTNKAWSVSLFSPNADTSWCVVSPLNGDAGTVNLVVNATENTGYDDRTVVLTIKTGNTTKTVTITQKQKDAIILSKNSYEIPEEGGTFEVEANTNVELIVSITSDATWIREETTGTRNLSMKKVAFIVDKNETSSVRTTTITLRDKYSDLSSTITVTQEARKTVAQTVQVDAPGTLSKLIGTDFKDIEDLTITGRINGNDVETIRQITNLKHLNIADVFIVSGGYYYPFERGITTVENTITEYMFRSLQTIILPNTITSIGKDAFFLSRMTLTSITIPNSVTSIGESAFERCRELTSITIPNSVTSIGVGAFTLCTSLASIDIPNSVTEIGSSAFSSCIGLTSITIPNSIRKINSSTFQLCSGLVSVTIPNSVTEIALSAFNKCTQLERFSVSPDNAHYSDINGVLTSKDKTKLIIYPHEKSQQYTIPNGITNIGGAAFSDCTGLTSVTIPNSVTSIGESAFSGCSGLASITIPNSVTEIGNYAFNNCTELTSVTIGSGVTKVGSGYFWGGSFLGCNSINEVRIKALIPPEGNHGIPYKNAIKLYIPKGSKEAYQNNEYWKGFYQYIEE